MSKEKNVNRVAFNLYLDNPEHKKVYDILQGADNKNQLIRKAILSYDENVEQMLTVPTTEDIKLVVEKQFQSFSENMIKQMDEKIHQLKVDICEATSSERQINFDNL